MKWEGRTIDRSRCLKEDTRTDDPHKRGCNADGCLVSFAYLMHTRLLLIHQLLKEFKVMIVPS